MAGSPHISVLLSAYNVGPYIGTAIDSILGQDYRDLELLFVDDASTDDTWNQAASRAGDRRLRMFRNETNRGVAISVNALFDESRGELIARMDGDDIARPDRLRLQVEAFAEGRDDVIGGWMTVFGDGRERLLRYPLSDAGIKAGLLFTSMFSQPTVTLRRETFAAVRYRSEAGILEDYDFWTRLALHGAVLRNLPVSLLRHRRHPSQTSSRHYSEQWRIAAEVSLRYIEALGLPASSEERSIHVDVRSPRIPGSLAEVAATEAWLWKLAQLYEGTPDAQSAIADHWYRYCLKASALGPRVYGAFRESPLLAHLPPKAWQHLALAGLGLGRISNQSRLYKRLQALSPAARPRKSDF